MVHHSSNISKRVYSLIALILCLVLTVSAGEKVSKLKNVLVFSGMYGWAHPSMPAAKTFFANLGTKTLHKFNVVETEDYSVFTESELEKYDVVVFNDNCKFASQLSQPRKTAFETWYANGGKFLSTHCFPFEQEVDWVWMNNTLGFNFLRHHAYAPGTAVLDPEGLQHEAAAGDGSIMNTISEQEEWYFWEDSPRDLSGVEITYTLDRSSIANPPAGQVDLAIAWVREVGGGKYYHSSFGHAADFYATDIAQNHYYGALLQLAGWDIRGCMNPQSPNYDSTATIPSNDCITSIIEVTNGNYINHAQVGKNLRISVRSHESHEIEVFHIAGSKIFSKSAHGNYQYNVDQLESGIYFVKVITAKTVSTEQIIIH